MCINMFIYIYIYICVHIIHIYIYIYTHNKPTTHNTYLTSKALNRKAVYDSINNKQ